ncbi:RNA-binding protein [Candidatus Woesearchaeota archaeon CG10_big_fil_rev_8_21_14_0_10_32_24]|nr:MAG: RNA-binding protein [Candidatus Woesearchaeota archaeon CG10_big_fil_rev_8_21_14_0_10_32_24]
MKYVELNTFLKIVGLATSGGEAKQLIQSGEILVNGVSETRNRKKLVVGDRVTFKGQEFDVVSDVTKMGEE